MQMQSAFAKFIKLFEIINLKIKEAKLFFFYIVNMKLFINIIQLHLMHTNEVL